jgi:hypothetical protein
VLLQDEGWKPSISLKQILLGIQVGLLQAMHLHLQLGIVALRLCQTLVHMACSGDGWQAAVQYACMQLYRSHGRPKPPKSTICSSCFMSISQGKQ